MHPLLRLWAVCAACVALLFALRGAWAPALACFLLSPAPVWAFAHGQPDQRRLSASWLVAMVLALAILAALFATIVSMGGLPPVHEWRGTLAGTR